MPFKDGSALRLTTALYYTPKDRCIQAKGIVPDLTLADIKVSQAEKKPPHFLREKDLERHLKALEEMKIEKEKKIQDLLINIGLQVLKKWEAFTQLQY